MSTLLKICTNSAWLEAKRLGVLGASAADERDGFIHLSAPHQVAATAAKHFAGQGELVLLFIDASALPADELRWEVSRGGDRFPHLYGELRTTYVNRVEALTLGADGVHVFPHLLASMGVPISPR